MRNRTFFLKATPLSYLFGLLAASLATLIELLIRSWAPGRFIIFYPTVLLVSLFFGFGAGVTATLGATIESAYFIMLPTFSFRISHPGDLVSLITFAMTGVAISAVNEALRRRQRKLGELELSAKIEEEKLRLAEESEKSLRRIFDSSPNALLAIVDPEGDIRLVNRQAEKLFGYSARELMGQKVELLVPERLREAHFGMRAKYVEAPEARQLGKGRELYGRRKDGSEIPIEIALSPISTEKGTFILTTVTDISDRKRSEESLKSTRQELEAIFNSVPASIWYKDTKNNFIRVNRAAAELTGRSPQEINGHSSYEIFPKEADAYYADDLEVIRSGKPKLGIIERVRQETGDVHWVQTDKLPIADEKGEVRGVLCFAMDITERKSNEERLRELNERLTEALRIRDDFISVASHELKTPLTSLLMQTEMRERALKKPNKSGLFDESNFQRMLEADKRLLWRLERLINDMLDVSRIRSGRFSIEPGRFDLCALVRDSVNRFSIQCSNAGVRVSAHTCESVVGYWDPQRIDQVLTNLLSNALKYGERTPIQVWVERIGANAQIKVRDAGRGIAIEDQERIFERFERRIKDSGITGLGLGLYITKRIVELHGGKIRVESDVGKGATFIVDLPIRQLEVANAA